MIQTNCATTLNSIYSQLQTTANLTQISQSTICKQAILHFITFFKPIKTIGTLFAFHPNGERLKALPLSANRQHRWQVPISLRDELGHALWLKPIY